MSISRLSGGFKDTAQRQLLVFALKDNIFIVTGGFWFQVGAAQPNCWQGNEDVKEFSRFEE